jgi:hypothetical protein
MSNAQTPPDPGSSASPYFAVKNTVRAAGSEDGIVLLNLETGKYFSLNPVGAQVWQGLAAGRSQAEIEIQLEELFDAPAPQIHGDVDRILATFVQAGMLERRPDPPAADFVITPAVPGKHPAAYPTVRMNPDLPDLAPHRRFLQDKIWFLRAFLALLYIDLLTRTRQFPGVHRAILRLHSSEREPPSALLAQITTAVNRAASFYYRRRWCLQRSAACAYLLRRHGFAAELVLGVQVMPFIAHAWVEWEGEVINDNPELTRHFAVLDRI